MILSKSQLVNNINSEISDQAYGAISPYDIRHNLLDIIDSASNLLLNSELRSLNLATSPSGNTTLGESSLEYLSLPGNLNQDNTAIGFSTLKSNFQGVKNTAIGSYSLSCNVYGQGNVAVGYNALAGNTVGSLNIGIGNYTLHNNKSGNGNIALGHGAGYYVSKTESNKLFIGYHPVDGQHICDNPTGSGWMPLMYGDLSGIKLGIGTKSLNEHGVLHVGGNILPSGANLHNLGHILYPWSKLYLASSIEFSNFSSIFASGSSILCVSGNIYPDASNKRSFGSSTNTWASGFFKDIVVTGVATINQLNYSNVSIYSNKTFYLGVNSSNQPLYSDSQLNDGGLVLKSSTDNKEYAISFRPPNEGMPGFSGAYNAVWYSNINFQVPSTSYIKTNSLVSYDTDAFNDNDSFGLFFNSGITYISRKNILDSDLVSSSGHVAGISNINFISNSGSLQDYSVSLMSLESGVSVSQKFLTGTKVRLKDSFNSNKDKLRGFELKYVDESLSNVVGPLVDRFVISSYNNTSKPINAIALMKQNADGGVFGITNIPSISDSITPKTIFNVRSVNDCVARFTSENTGNYKSAIQLLGSSNCETSGVEFTYLNNSGISDINLFSNSIKTCFVRFRDNQQIGILSSGITNATLTIGHSGIPNMPVVSIKDNTFVLNSGVVADSGYVKLYSYRVNRHYADQNNALFLLDASGNTFDLVVNKLDSLDARAVYTDGSGNTYAGYLSPSGRKSISNKTMYNTAYGYRALSNIFSGSGNVAVGYESLDQLVSGNNNIVIGRSSASGLNNTYQNIIIGNSSFNKTSDLSNTSGNIVVGHNIGNSASGSYQFLLGLNNNLLFNGTLGPSDNDKKLVMPNNGRLYLNNINNSESLCLRNNTIEVIDSGGSNYPENTLSFKFSGNNSADLLVLDHSKDPMTNNVNYYSPPNPSGRPFAQVNGDLRIRGSIRFSDGTSLETSSGIKYATDIAQSGLSIAQSGISRLDALFIEGYMPNGLAAPATDGIKTSGVMVTKDQNWNNTINVFIHNRDITNVIHSGAYVIATRINNEYRPIWVSSSDTTCICCNN